MGTIGVNPPRTPVTKGSSGIAAATVPNVCKMPGPPAPFVPTPLPNIGKSGDSPKKYSKKVKFDGQVVAIRGASFGSMGDAASKGTGGGIVSSNTHGPTKFVGPGSLNVNVEGKNVQLLADPMLNNCGPSGSPPNAATLAGVIQGTATPGFANDVGDAALADELCDAACDAMHAPQAQFRTRQDQMACRFSQTSASGRAQFPSYMPTGSSVIPEVSQRIPSAAGGGISTLMSTSGRTVPGTGAVAPRSMMKSLRASTTSRPVTRWDFVVPSVNGSSRNNHIRKYIEVKFPGDSLTPNQQLARQRMTPSELAKIVEMEPDQDCVCVDTATGNVL